MVVLFNIIIPSYHTILVGRGHFDISSDLAAIASARELHPRVKPYTNLPGYAIYRNMQC